MTFQFESTKNNELTVSLDGIYFHSKYNPSREAENFVSLQRTDFIPETVFIIEPALSYCADFFKKKFPHSKVVAIRFCKEFESYDSLFDNVFYYNEKQENQLGSFLSTNFDETKLPYSLISVWEPSKKLFEKEINQVLSIFVQSIKESHTILRTRSFFEKKWLINSIISSKYISQNAYLKEKGKCPVLIVASGPSALPFLPLIKKYRSSFFLIALSSAISPLYSLGIKPDMCLSTDGGFWANKHLFQLLRDNKNTYLALACEGACPKKVLKTTSILPLIYSDGTGSKIAKSSGLITEEALRCGTVSGTALYLAKKISSGPVFFTGLDLKQTKGFQHIQPNMLEIGNQVLDSKIISTEKRVVKTEFSNQKDSLKIYENWFSEQNIENVFRIIDNPGNKLGKIKDITCDEFEKIISQYKGSLPILDNLTRTKDTSHNLQNIVSTFIKQDDWLKNVYPVEYLNYEHALDENKKNMIYNKMISENDRFTKKICSITQ